MGHTYSDVSHRLSTAVPGCPPREPQSNSQTFWQTHFRPMLLCLTPAAAPGSQSLCRQQLDFSAVCSPFPVQHCERLGCLCWPRQHGRTERWAVRPHSAACLFARVKSRKRPFPTSAGLSEEMERHISGLGDRQAVGFKTKWEQALPGDIHHRTHLLGLAGECSGSAGVCTMQPG